MRRPPVIFALAALVLLGAPAIGLAAGGQEIVFTSDRAENLFGEIYAARVNGAGFRDITRNPAADTNAALSPDGTRLAFWSNRTGKSSVYLSHADGTGLRRVRGDLDTGGQTPGPLSWSPDGTLLLAAVPRSHGGGGVRNEVDVIDARRVTARRLLPDGCFTPEWSQDGQLVACSQAGEVVVLDLQGHRRFRFAGGEPMWSANGMLAVSDGGTVVYDENGQRLARFPGQPRAWSPDGSLLAVERAGALMVVGSDGSNRGDGGAPSRVRLIPVGARLRRVHPGRAVDRVRRDGRRSEARHGHRRAERHASGLRRVVCRLRALRVRAPASRRRADPCRQPVRSLVASARAAPGGLRGRASPLVAERPQDHLRHEPSQQRPRALRDPVGRHRAARADRRLDRRARPGVVAGREHAGVHVGALRRARVQGVRAHAAHRPRRRDVVAERSRATVRASTTAALRGRPTARRSRSSGRRATCPRACTPCNPDGSGVAPLASGMRATAPAWSPDGSMLAFVSSAAGLGRHHGDRRGRRRRAHRGDRRRRASAPPTCAIPSGRPTAP